MAHGKNKDSLARPAEGKIDVYREYFRKLLAIPKPLRDQLLIELPTLQGLRTGEISSMKAEYFDFEHNILKVLDSKKGTHRFVPLNPTVGKHGAEYIEYRGINKGYLFTPETMVGRPRKPYSKARGTAISESHIVRIWAKWCKACGIPAMSPRMGRAYFACEWMMSPHEKSAKDLQAILGQIESATRNIIGNA